MFLSSYLSVALAVSVNSFLIPGDADALSPPNDVAAPLSVKNEETITLDCATCPYALNSERNGEHEWTNDVQSDLHVKIDTDGNSLRLNGAPFYPVQEGIPPWLRVSQTKKENEDPTPEGYQGDLRLSYSLEYEEKHADDGSSLVSVVMTIMALDGEMVKIDNVKIKSIRTADGKLVLHSVKPVHPDPNSLDAKCSNVLCRVFAKIINGVKKAKAAAKATGYKAKCACVKCFKDVAGAIKHIHKLPAAHMPTGLPLEEAPVNKLPTHHRFRPGMFGGQPHHAHHRKGFFHHMGHVMWSAVKLAFMPILIGIAFGMAASAVGMLIGQLVVSLWRKYRKTNQVVYIPVVSDEKPALPVYEDLPTIYEALDEKEVEQNA